MSRFTRAYCKSVPDMLGECHWPLNREGNFP